MRLRSLLYVPVSSDRFVAKAHERGADAIILDLDVVTALGIVVAEVVTNSYDHAFPDGDKGSIVVSVRRAEGDIATITISDDGTGFKFAMNKSPRAWARKWPPG